MNLFTEKEYRIQSQHLAFRLKHLFQNDRNSFNSIVDFLPQPVYVNDRETLEYEVFADVFFSYGQELELLYEIGIEYLPSISNPHLYQNAVNKAKILNFKNDFDEVSDYLQCVSMNGSMVTYFTNKILLNETLSLNTTFFPHQQSGLEKMLKQIIPWGGEKSLLQWQRFQTLTKREKEIIKLIANGKSNQEISEILIISKHSVHTHRKNIYRKLDVSKIAEIVKISLALELL